MSIRSAQLLKLAYLAIVFPLCASVVLYVGATAGNGWITIMSIATCALIVIALILALFVGTRPGQWLSTRPPVSANRVERLKGAVELTILALGLGYTGLGFVVVILAGAGLFVTVVIGGIMVVVGRWFVGLWREYRRLPTT